jgi:hypothetical protein
MLSLLLLNEKLSEMLSGSLSFVYSLVEGTSFYFKYSLIELDLTKILLTLDFFCGYMYVSVISRFVRSLALSFSPVLKELFTEGIELFMWLS